MTFSFRSLICVLLFPILIVGCSNSSSGSSEEDETTASGVWRNPKYAVSVALDVKYAEGLSHESWNSINSEPIDLMLDAYIPDNEDVMRPAMVFIHGGGFVGGDKGDGAPAYFAQFFAERGFVGFSINYRLVGDYGTIPDDWLAAIDGLTDLSAYQKEQAKAFYPAGRDAKAAIRFIRANAQNYGIDPEKISVIGGSAGSYIAVGLAVTETEDYFNELSVQQDPTLSSTNMNFDSSVVSVVNHWGGPGLVEALDVVYGIYRWDSTDAPILTVHGTEDSVVPYENALIIQENYQLNGVEHQLITLEGEGHGPWTTQYQGQTLPELSFDFIAETLELEIQE